MLKQTWETNHDLIQTYSNILTKGINPRNLSLLITAYIKYDNHFFFSTHRVFCSIRLRQKLLLSQVVQIWPFNVKNTILNAHRPQAMSSKHSTSGMFISSSQGIHSNMIFNEIFKKMSGHERDWRSFAT
jgi:hypothetical protein